MPNTRKNKRRIWKGSGGPDDTDTTKSSTGDSSRSSTPSFFSKVRNALISSDTPLNPPSRQKPNSNYNTSAINKRDITIQNLNQANKEHKSEIDAMRNRLTDNEHQNRIFNPNNLNTRTREQSFVFDPFEDSNGKQILELSDDRFNHPYNLNDHDFQKLKQNNRGGKSRRKSKKSKKRTRKTKRKSRR